MDPYELDSIRMKKERQEHIQLTIILVVKLIVIVTTMIREQTYQIKEVSMQSRDKIRHRLANLSRLIRESDVICKNELRVNRHTFGVLCEMVSSIGELRRTKNTEVEEMVIMFLFTLAHHKKNRSIVNYFVRSEESVSRQFNLCIRAVLKLHHHLLKKPTPIPEDCQDSRWKYFKRCLGALDGTFISVHVSNVDRSRYRTKKEKMKEKFPSCELKASQVESKIKFLKEKYIVISDMLKSSGFHWDDKNKMVQCDRQCFDEFCVGHPRAKGLWKSPFPLFEKLQLIYDADRADGSRSEDMDDSINMDNECIDLENEQDDSDINIAMIEGVSQIDAIDATSFLSRNTNELDAFYSCSNDYWKKLYVERLILRLRGPFGAT
ncbi:hypothetical protein C2S52_015234 [Perilla frutescens var. hirtella]|nr:hypothetical protein C2S52_015234 [Perilla frutescens var. hirtella]